MSMAESFGVNPEQQRPGDELSQLHNTLQAAFLDPSSPEESFVHQQEQLETIIANAHQLPLDERAHNLVDHYADIVRHLWFGGQIDEPPDAVGYYWAGHHDNDWGEFNFNENVLDEGTFDSITYTLMPLGLADLLTERASNAQQNVQTINTAFSAFIDSTPAGRWVSAFAINEPVTERPLTPIQRASAEATMRANAIQRFGTAPHAPNQVHPAARNHISRQRSLLDDKTIPRPHIATNEDFALQGLRRFTETSLAQQRTATTPVYRQEYDTNDGYLKEYGADESLLFKHDLVATSLQQADKLGWELPYTHGAYEISRDYYSEAFERVYTGSTTFQEICDAALAYCKESYLDRFTQGYSLVSGHYAMDAIRYLKLAPKGWDFDEESPYGAGEGQYLPHDRVERINFSTEADYKKDQRKWVGNIERNNDPIPGALRLPQQAYHMVPVPLHPADESAADLILYLKNFKGDPHVPGYTLIAADRLAQRYYLTYNPDTDPYRPNGTIIEPEVQAHLVAAYQALDLPNLAKRLQSAHSPTVAELAAMVQQENQYAFRSPLEPDLSSMLSDLPSYRIFVKDQALRATCAVFSGYGKATTDEGIFPEYRTFVTAGYVIESGAPAISGVQHAQLAVLREGDGEIESIIEWTPAQASSPAALQHARDNLPHQRVDQTSYGDSKVKYLGEATSAPTTLREQVALSMSTLFTQLGVIYAPGATEKVPRDYLLTKTRKLGAQHPLNQTLGALLIAHDQLDSAGTLPTSTIHLLQDARAEVVRHKSRRDVGAALPLLTMLETNLHPIFQYLPEDNPLPHS